MADITGNHNGHYSGREKSLLIRNLHIITRFDKGGSAENTFLTLTGLDHARYEKYLIAGSDGQGSPLSVENAAAAKNLERVRADGVKTFILPELVRPVDPMRDITAFLRIRRLIRSLAPHIVHTHTSKAGIIGRLAAFSARVPIVIHTPHGHVFWGYFSAAITRFFIALEKVAARATDRLIMLTDQEKADHLRFRIAPPEKFVVIHSGVQLERFSQIVGSYINPRDEKDIPTNAFVIGTVGRLTAIKGQRYLIMATSMLVREIPELICLIVGDGELRQKLEELAVTLGIEKRVIFPGWQTDVANYIAAMDLFVMPSLNEGMGRTVVEAMAAEKAVVATDVGGLKDLVTPGVNGLLVPPGDAETLTAAIRELYRNPELRRTMGQNGMIKANTFTSTAMIKKIDELYMELLREKNAGS